MSKSKIEWTDYTWNPISGCTKVSQGCKNCYAERFAGRKLKPFDTMVPRLLSAQGPRPREFRDVQFHPESFDRLRKIKEGSRVFVCSISDLFHETVKDEWIEQIFDRIFCHSEIANKIAHLHNTLTFQILTKRPQRALEYFMKYHTVPIATLENVWIGTSIEDQETADERIPILMKIPVLRKFISIEPMLGPIDLSDTMSNCMNSVLDFHEEHDISNIFIFPKWIICGGESGPGSRPMASDWVRTIKDQCKMMNTPFFFKQWGEFIPKDQIIDWDKSDLYAKMDFIKQGKKHTGNILDGVVYNEFPKV